MAALTATTALAQDATVANLRDGAQAAQENFDALQPRQATFKTAKASRRVKGDAWNLYYTRPEGTLFRGSSPTGGSYYAERLYLPPQFTGILANKATEPAKTRWMNRTMATDYSEYAEENGDFSINTYGYSGSGWYLYNLAQDVKTAADADSVASFHLTKNSGAVETNANYFPAYTVDSLSWKRFYSGIAANGMWYWGAITSSGYTFGTGVYTSTNEETGETKDWRSFAVVQPFPKPASPLYVENIVAFAASGTEAIKDDGEVTMTIRKYDDENGLGDVIAVLKATTADTALVASGTSKYAKTSTDGTYRRYTLTFSQRVEDEFGGVAVEPFVINDQFAVVIGGLDNDKLDFGLSEIEVDPDDQEMIVDGCVNYFYNGEETTNIWYGGDNVLNLNFNCTFDYVEPWTSVTWTKSDETKYTQENANVLKADADGNITAYDEGAQELGVNFALVQTGFNWTDEEGNDLYYSEELPEWVTAIVVNQDERLADSYKDEPVYVSFEVEPLPAGVTGRSATIYLQGYGYKATEPIILLQGDATLETSIAATKANAKVADAAMFNMAGQRVNNSFKGLVIKNGQKFMNK